MSATALGAATGAGSSSSNNTNSESQQTMTSSPRSTWTCNTCDIVFESGQEQREHMKESWHVYNLKRRIASLPPISSEIFKERISTKPELPKADSDEEPESETEEDIGPPYQCLFCPLKFADDSEDLADTLEHMFTVHGLFVPDQSMILDLGSFLGYLATEIRVWNECLYCGTARNSTSALQSHMRDSGHCMLNLDREPELLEFWEVKSDEESESDAPKKLANKPLVLGKELQLPSGKLLGSRSTSQNRLKTRRIRAVRLALQDGTSAPTSASPSTATATDTAKDTATDTSPSSAATTSTALSSTVGKPTPSEPSKKQAQHQLARRDEMGIQNISPQQRQALMLATKRSQKEATIAARAREWSYASRANSQKHDQNYGALSWAKGGLHQLLPR